MTAPPQGEVSLETANKEVVARLYAEVFGAGRLEVADEVVAADAADRHDEQDRRGPGRVKEVASMLRAAFPDQQWDTHRLVAEGDHVAMYSTWSGTHQGPFMGMPPTGRHVSVSHLYLFEVRNGQVTEYAAVRDDLSMLRQLGLAVGPPPPALARLPSSAMRAALASSIREAGETRSVAPLELFFDLVYVFAITQLSHHLVDHFEVRAAVETLVLTLAVVYAWYMTAWLSNWLSPTRPAVQALLLTIMLGSLLMSSAISGAFDDRALLFAGAYVAIQVIRAGFAAAAFPAGSARRIHFVNDLGWEVATGAIWIAGALTEGDTRLLLWIVAVVITYIGVALAHPVPGRSSHLVTKIGAQESAVDSGILGEHLLERLRLFFLIVLGETLLTTGSAFAAHEVELGPLVAFVNAFACTVAIWWCWFQRAEGTAIDASESEPDASGVAWLSTIVLTLIVLAIIGIAVTDELAIAHPGDDPDALYLALAFGGPALFLLAQLGFMARVGAPGLRARGIAVGVLAVLGVALSGTTLLAASVAATAVLVAVAVSDTRLVARATATATV